MRIGVPAEIKDNEYRVGMTPPGDRDLTSDGHTVFVQKGAGHGSSFAEDEYQAAGATDLGSVLEVGKHQPMSRRVE